MTLGELLDLRGPRSGRALLLIPLGLIAAVCTVDILAPPDIHLGPLLVAAPAITAAFAGPRLTTLIGFMAVGGQIAIGVARRVLTTENLQAQIAALVLVSAVIVAFCLFRDRHEHQLTQSRSVAQAVQAVLFPTLPRHSGPLEIASLYFAAQDEAAMGGDLFAAARTSHSTRLLIADVRGKGLPAIDHASLLLGAFRAASHRQPTLPRLAVHLDGAMRWDSRQWQQHQEPDIDEAFATALIVEIPDHDPVLHVVTCGHPSPLLLDRGHAGTLPLRRIAPPLGLGGLCGEESYAVESFAFNPSDVLLLYTDGVLEARDGEGRFYPLADRAAAWSAEHPGQVLRLLREDLVTHTRGRLSDDAAAVAVRHADA
ncbi:PP2C family protein-serine/threonine phosphatase [Streptomyces sp. TP-A0356]|uniref:PP2C family protein-serine/threonine phosphatase n=1 Tax=Streptomyces sp. TP-A0356 TaxID=1359208 RepID=UPI000A5394D9|nr:PP2C family protein-serine/threonine phosphatase [Streptomyces sp. TP-A0356]